MEGATLVTGASGFVGRYVVAELRARGRTVVALDRRCGDVTKAETFMPYRDRNITSVVHLAARTFVPDSWSDPAGFFDTNVGGTTQVLEFCRTVNASILYVSAYIYGKQEALPINESAPISCGNPYAKSKHLGEEVCRSYHDLYGIPVTILRPFNVYGPQQGVQFLIPRIISQARSGGVIEVLDLAPRRDYVFVTDLVGAILAAESRKSARTVEVFNVGTGVSHSVSDVIDTIFRISRSVLPVLETGIKRPNEIGDTIADISKAMVGLNWSPRYCLETGLRKCLESFGDLT